LCRSSRGTANNTRLLLGKPAEITSQILALLRRSKRC
jgi:hypothetical protein